MNNVYTAVVECKDIIPLGLIGYNHVSLGIKGSQADINIRATCSHFVIGRMYLIQISQQEGL